MNFQTMVSDLTGLATSNSSLLDEGTAAAEAMAMCAAGAKGRSVFVVDERVHPQSIAVMRTRAEPMGLEVLVCNVAEYDFGGKKACGVMVQYPDTYGHVQDWRAVVDRAHANGTLAVFATDLLALTRLTPPGELGADIAVGSAQRFGMLGAAFSPYSDSALQRGCEGP